MGTYELHADYDRDGKVTAEPAEYAKRAGGSGALLMPNIDRDDRSLPAQVADGPAIALDWTLPTKPGQENDLASATVKEIVAQPGADLYVRGTGPLGGFLRVYDDQGRALPPTGRTTEYKLTLKSSKADFKVECITLGGSPLLTGTPLNQNPRRVDLELVSVDSNYKLTRLDIGTFTLPSLILTDDLAPATRVYIAPMEDEVNQPTLIDVGLVCREASVVLVPVPTPFNGGDAWLQDQLQFGYLQGPKGPMTVVIHLPRARTNLIQSTVVSTNLAPFVRSHFPCKTIALFDDFWRRTIRVTDVTGLPHEVGLMESQYLMFDIGHVYQVRGALIEQASALVERAKLETAKKSLKTIIDRPKPNVLQAHLDIKDIYALIKTAATEVKRIDARPQVAKQMDLIVDRLGQRVTQSDRRAPVSRGVAIDVPIAANQRIEVTPKAATDVYHRLRTVHDSLNFGGNIECSPPIGSAPRGKIVIGTGTEDYAQMDEDLIKFFESQDAQPLVMLDTSWLEVAHVDEIMSFVPSSSSAGFEVVRASSGAGMNLIETALALYRSGIPSNHVHNAIAPPVPLYRPTVDGNHPVTMMLRGKRWMHLHKEGDFEHKEPPRIFRALSDQLMAPFVDNANPFKHPVLPEEDRYEPGPLKDGIAGPKGKREYLANTSIFEFHLLEKQCNSAIEAQFLVPLAASLTDAFPGSDVLKLPVLFDAVPVYAAAAPAPGAKPGPPERDFVRTTTSFIPSVVNFQNINGYLMIPKPYGPRMGPDDAAKVVGQCLANEHPSRKFPTVDRKYFEKRGLTKSTAWFRDVSGQHLNGPFAALYLSRWFADGFPGMEEKDIQAKLIKANPGKLTAQGNLKSGWQHLVIPEDNVDLFEAYTYVLLESIGAKIRFVDSWYYHVNGGGIHCGTNVLRSLRPAQT